jgi:hypothetical protein
LLPLNTGNPDYIGQSKSRRSRRSQRGWRGWRSFERELEGWKPRALVAGPHWWKYISRLRRLLAGMVELEAGHWSRSPAVLEVAACMMEETVR